MSHQDLEREHFRMPLAQGLSKKCILNLPGGWNRLLRADNPLCEWVGVVVPAANTVE